MTPHTQQHYLDVLGIKRGATLDDIHTAYYLLIEKYSHNPTELEVEERQKLQHAYNILCRSYEDAPPVKKKATDDHAVRRGQVILLVLVLLFGISALIAMNWSSIKLEMTHIEPGTVMRLNAQHNPYGTVLRFDKQHRFHTGDPVPAYEVRLAATGEIVWLNKRVVVKGMRPMLPTDDDR